MAPPKRRVSYVIPPPLDHVPRLKLPPLGLPRHGSPRPLLFPSQHQPEAPSKPSQPRHRLGVTSLALDTTTQLEGLAKPEGILYTGSRDGQVISWDLGLTLRPRQNSLARRHRAARWETLTGMAGADEETEEEERRDGDILGDVKESGGRRRRASIHNDIPYEHQWELDLETLNFTTDSRFRQSAQMHTDWINDILLCNYNQTVISASSDGTVKAWNPHSNPLTDPLIVGTHADYVRSLAFCRESNWIVSGSFDRSIKLWDLTSSSPTPQPLLSLNPPDATAPKASVYALAADAYGHAIASGSPERVVRMWDPRSGKRTGKLVGHTDNIRAILISDDGRYLLTGSTDASIKLWSLSSQRCLHTFMHHTDSVWSLHSTHPLLKIFYSGDKSGVVCKVDVEDCSEVADGICIVLARESSEEGGEGINKITTADNGLLWTASGSSSISRWRVPKRLTKHDTGDDWDLFSDPAVATKRISTGTEPPWSAQPSTHRGNVVLDDEFPAYPGVPLCSLVRLAYPNSSFSPSSFMSRGRDAEVATLYSAASVVSVPSGRSPFNAAFQRSTTLTSSNIERDARGHVSMTNTDQNPINEAHATYTAQELSELASDATPFNPNPDMVVAGSRGLVRAVLLNDRMHALTVDTVGEVAVWDIVRGMFCGWYTKEDVQAASMHGSLGGSTRSKEQNSPIGDKEWSPREALEAVRERIEGEAVVSAWSSVDTKTGVLTVHISERCFEAEIYADEAGFDSDKHFNDEFRINIGKWVLRNLFLGFVREEQRIRRRRDVQGSESNQPVHTNSPRTGGTGSDLNGNYSVSTGILPPLEISRSPPRLPICTAVVTSASALPAILPSLPSVAKPSPLLTPMIPLKTVRPITSTPQSPSFDKPAMLRPIRTHGLDIPPPSAGREPDHFSSRARRPSTASTALSDGDFSSWGGPGSPPRHVSDASGPISPITPGGSFMGRLKSFGKGPGRRIVNDTAPNSPATSNVLDTPAVPEHNESNSAKTPTQVLLSNPLSPPSSNEVPTHTLPPNMMVMMTDESYPGWKTVYRGSVSTTWADIYALEENMPLWLLEYVLFNKAVVPPASKISFVLLPWPNPDPDGERLPELLNVAQSKLTASKFLRVRKLTHHVQEKIEKLSSTPNSLSYSVDTPRPGSPSAKIFRTRAEETYEVLCNDIVLSLDMTLAAVRQYFWRQSSELTMYYRVRSRPAVQGSVGIPI